MICFAKEAETGIKILVDNDSYEVTVCDQSDKYSNGFEAVLVSKSLFAMINGELKVIYVSEETIAWLESNNDTVTGINLEKEDNNKVKLLSGGGFAIEDKLKEYGWTNKKLNDMYIEAKKLFDGC